MAVSEPFVWGRGGARMTPEQIARQREVAEALAAAGVDTSPVGHWLQGAARMANALAGRVIEGRAGRAERENQAADGDMMRSLLASLTGVGAPSSGGGLPEMAGGPGMAAPMDPASARVAAAHGDMRPYLDALASIESAGSGDYAAVGPTHSALGRALGRYQVMEANIGPWSQEAIGRPVTPDEFLANPEIQDAVAAHKFGQYMNQFGDPGMAAQAWFAGPGGVGTNRSDVLGTSVPEYAQRFNAALGSQTQAALESLPVGGTMTMPQSSGGAGFPPAPSPVQVAQSGGINPAIIEALSNPNAGDGVRQIAGALLQQQMQASMPQKLINAGDGNLYDPNTGQWIQAPGSGAGAGPAAFQALHMRALASGLQEGSPEYQQFMAAGGRTGEESAAVQRIGRLTENLMATGDFLDPADAAAVATGIVDGRLRLDRHPVTGVSQIVDMATGRIVYGGSNQQHVAPDTSGQVSAPMPEFGSQFPAASESFGVEGSLKGLGNTVGDAIGLGVRYPEVQQTQADFGVLRESLMNDIQSAYGRQPPSWLMQEIRSLTPAAGSPFEGPETAQSKLRAIGRQLASELRLTETMLGQELSPANRQEMETKRAGLTVGIGRVQSALEAFGPGQGSGGPQVGAVEDGYRYIGGDPARPESWEPVQ